MPQHVLETGRNEGHWNQASAWSQQEKPCWPHLITFCGEMTGWGDERSAVAIVPPDVRKAFRSVCQNSPMETLKQRGLAEERGRWVESG